MKRLIIVIPPVIAFAIFVYFYNAHSAELAIKTAEKAAAAEQAKIEEDARKQALQEAADKEAQRLKDERAAAIAAQKEKLKNEKEDRDRKIIEETEAANAQSKRLQAQIIKLQKDILAVRVARDKAQAEAMETRLDLEKARIDKRNAEFEIQRYTDMLASRMEQSQALFNDQIAAAAAAKRR